jgi:hypothetical protein
VLLGLLEKWSQSFCHIGEAQIHHLDEALAGALELPFFQCEVSSERTSGVLDVLDWRHPGRRRPSQEGDVLSQDPGMLKLLDQVRRELVDRTEEFCTGDRCNMAQVLND